MSRHSILSAYFGAITWRCIMKGHEDALIIVIPDNNSKLIVAMRDAVSKYINNSGNTYSQLLIVCTNQISNNIHRLYKGLMQNVRVISSSEMIRLVDFIMLTSKQYGATCQKNVKLVSLEMPYNGQLKLIADCNLFPLDSIVKNSMLDLE